MKLKSFFKRLFNKDILEKFNSPFNGEILVVKELSGKTVMRVGGISQSGGLVEKIWRQSLSSIRYLISDINSVLILGLGCGPVAELINEKWPKAQMTGIEIDPVVVKIGKKYFGLDKIPNLKIVEGDAIKFVRSGGEKWEASRGTRSGKSLNSFDFARDEFARDKWDLILVDLYKGQEFPKEAESEKFLNGLKKILNKDGLIIFNRLNFGNHKTRTAGFIQKLKKTFSKVAAKNTEFNLFISCSF